MINPTISVLIPSYNHEKYIEETLESILNQTYQDFEIIITDDGSTDKTVETIKKFQDPRIKLFVFEENKGACTALNNCINKSKGKFIAYISSDDVWELNKLEKQVKFLNKNPEIAIVFTKAQIIDENSDIFTNKNHFYYSIFDQDNRSREEWLRHFFYNSNCLCHPSALIRRNVYENIGLYNERMANLPDFEMWIRTCLKYNIHILDEKLIKFRVRSESANASSSGNPKNLIRSRFEWKQILDHYLKIDDINFFLKIFPEASKYGEPLPDLIPYFLGRLIQETNLNIKQLWGMEAIYNLMQSSKIATILEKDYNFKYSDFLKMTSEVDVFNLLKPIEEDKINQLNNSLIEKQRIIDELEKKEVPFIELKQNIKKINTIAYEMEFQKNYHRSLSQRFFSWFPGFYILFKGNGGLKHSLVNIKGYNAVKKNGLFDEGYYLKDNKDIRFSGVDPLLHYIYHGFKEGRKPGPGFDADYYLKTYADVRNSNLNPLIHYALYGIKENRKPTKTKKEIISTKIKDNIDLDQAINPNSTSLNIAEPKNENSLIEGGINDFEEKRIIYGWLAKIGDVEPRIGVLKIDNDEFEIYCSSFRPDLKEGGINEGKHGFEFTIPPKFNDGKRHSVQLIDNETEILIAQKEKTWANKRPFTDFSGFLANSLVSPDLYAPFSEEDKRCFATMENITNYLVDRSQKEDVNLVSVIMPVYNRIDTVKLAINSVLEQTYSNIELIIVDDGSTDGTTELLENIKDNRVVVLHNKKCQGVSKARNKGLEHAKGKYIAYLDSDNMWDQRYIAAMVGTFLNLHDADALYCGQILFRGNEENPFLVRFGSFNKPLLFNKNYIDLNAFCHTREIYNLLGGFDEDLERFVDWDLIMHISNSAKIYSVPVLLSHYYLNKAENTITNDPRLANHDEKVRKKYKNYSNTNYNSNPESSLKKVSIVIPSYESLEDISRCINSILNLQCKDSLEIIVVDNASSKPVVDYLTDLEFNSKIKLIKNDINYGFTYAVNQGIELSKPDNDIVILNNDALMTHGCIETLQNAAYKLPNCGLVVPQQVLPGGTKTITTHVPYANPVYDCDVNLSSHHANIINMPLFHSGEIVELSFAPFFCVYIKRDVLDNSRGLDAQFGRHYRSDRIFCNYLRHVMNLKIYYIADAIVFHKLQKSTDILSNSNKSEFNTLFHQNQWDSELLDKLNYKKAVWDI